jgi:hypothetical protein
MCLERERKKAADWLQQEHESDCEGRTERLVWLMDISRTERDYLAFGGGWVTKSFYEEARYCYIYGQFTATIVIGLSCIEHLLASILFATGKDRAAKAGLKVLVEMAVETSIISSETGDNVNEIREKRNPLVHFRPPLGVYPSGSVDMRDIGQRVIASGTDPFALLRSDAEQIIVVMQGLIELHSH